MSHLISLLDIPLRNVFLTLLYLPHAVRPEADVLFKMGNVLAQLDKWQVSFPLTSSVGALDVTAQLRSVVVAAHAGGKQCEYERTVFSRGLSLNSLTLFPPSERSTKQGSSKGKKEEETLTPKKGEGQASQGADHSPSPSSSGGSRGKGKPGSGFKAPRRVAEGAATGSALEAREARGRVRLSAEALEANAEKVAEQASKRARAANASNETGKGKKSGKSKGPSQEDELDLDDFPAADC